jgi:hypothetical protein
MTNFDARFYVDRTCSKCRKKGCPSQADMEFEEYQKAVRRYRRVKPKKRGRVKGA